jgi:hypothetical protein
VFNAKFAIRAIVSISFIALGAPEAAGGSPPIVPLHALVHFSRTSSAPVWSSYIYSATGKKAYILWLEPEYTTHKDLAGVDLVLNEGDRRDPRSNLLAPSRNWHGIQLFEFGAGDLIQGPDKAFYGVSRTLPARDRGFGVQVKVLRANVSEIPKDRIPARVRELQSDWYQLDGLELTISVENINERGSLRSKVND